MATRFTTGVEVIEPSELLSFPINQDAHDRVFVEFLGGIGAPTKAETRTDEQNRSLAENDTSLFLTVLDLNHNMAMRGQHILRGSAYLLTRSGRYRRVAHRLSLPPDFVVRPTSIAGVLDLLMDMSLSPHEVVAAMSNPFMAAAVETSWTDVSILVQSGIETRDKSIARLRRDLDESLHAQIVQLQRDDELLKTDEAPSKLGAVRNLLGEAKRRGYRIAKDVEAVMEAVERESPNSASSENEELMKRLADVEAKFGEFGKRKEKYLRRLAAGRIRK
jgi:hypothetical protein